MTRKEAEELMPVIQAYIDGKQIQKKPKDYGTWTDVKLPAFNPNISEYRIKPETKYRPFKNADECWQEMQKHQPFGWVKSQGQYRQIVRTVDNIFKLDNADNVLSFADGLRFCRFTDNTPFGIKEVEK